MVLNTLWERFFFKQIAKYFFVFLSLFFLGYSLLEYSIHMEAAKNLTLPYFAYQFIKRASLLVPLGLILATIKTLCTANAQGELVALQVAGLSRTKILRPLFLFAGLCTLFSFVNTEYLQPNALNYLDNFRHTHLSRSQGRKKEPIHVLHLKNQGKLVYQTYDKNTQTFVDVFWIASIDDIWKMKALNADSKAPVGYFVDHIQRTKEGLLEKTESFEKISFSHLKWEKQSGLVPMENRSISNLVKQYRHSGDKTQALTYLLHKCSLPFLPFLIILALAPICMRYSRGLPVFFIYAFSLFGFLALFAALSAGIILGENNTVPPVLTICGPLAVLSIFFSWRFLKKV